VHSKSDSLQTYFEDIFFTVLQLITVKIKLGIFFRFLKYEPIQPLFICCEIKELAYIPLLENFIIILFYFIFSFFVILKSY